MTTATTTLNNRMERNDGRSRRSLEELVDRVMEALFVPNVETPQPRSATRTIHEARRLRQAGDPDGALAVLADVDVAKATPNEARWAYAEWLDLVRRRFGDGNVLLYSQGTGRAAALTPRNDGALEVVAVLGMRWRPGKVVSRRSLRGLRPLAKACPRHGSGGGASWS